MLAEIQFRWLPFKSPVRLVNLVPLWNLSRYNEWFYYSQEVHYWYIYRQKILKKFQKWSVFIPLSYGVFDLTCLHLKCIFCWPFCNFCIKTYFLIVLFSKGIMQFKKRYEYHTFYKSNAHGFLCCQYVIEKIKH